MAQTQNTQYKSNDEASEIHRLFGSGCYLCDADQINTTDSAVEGTAMEYMFKNNKTHTVAFVDFKQGLAQDIPCKQNEVSIRQQARLAAEEMKVPTPFFIILTYLLEEYPTKMYYVLPANKVAREMFQEGRWMTLRVMSHFQHVLRGKTFDPNEVISPRLNGLLMKYGFPIGMKLGELPNKKVEYPLPHINYDFLNTL